MRRLSLLAGLTALVAWLSAITPSLNASYAPGAQDTTIPHLGCVDNQCVEIYECGADDCSACPGCNPEDEYNCIGNGGTWDPSSCTCTPRVCDPWAEQECWQNWGTWDPYTCTCNNSCNPQPAVAVDSWHRDELLYCTACQQGAFHHIDGTAYVQYCQDGRIWDQYTIETGWVGEDWTFECDYMCWEW